MKKTSRKSPCRIRVYDEHGRLLVDIETYEAKEFSGVQTARKYLRSIEMNPNKPQLTFQQVKTPRERK